MSDPYDMKASAEDLARHLSYFVPPGFQLMRQGEIDRILNECEALRIERDAARKELLRGVQARQREEAEGLKRFKKRKTLATGENRLIVALAYYNVGEPDGGPMLVLPDDASDADKRAANEWLAAVQRLRHIPVDTEWVHLDSR